MFDEWSERHTARKVIAHTAKPVFFNALAAIVDFCRAGEALADSLERQAFAERDDAALVRATDLRRQVAKADWLLGMGG